MFKSPRGTNDILPKDWLYWNYVISKAENIARFYNYDRIETPVIEDSNLFLRSIGANTDIVEKEMYIFPDHGGDNLSLRAEGTAPVCRAYLEHGLHNSSHPLRLYYISSMFRYDRPQAGRYRQFHQFGIELIGEEDYSADFEIIEFAIKYLETLGLTKIKLLINNIGDLEDREKYIADLKKYFKNHINSFNAQDRKRFEENPLRLLDSKSINFEQFVDIPQSINYLNDTARLHWENLLKQLEHFKISYTIDPKLVRGLDYYNRTVFEIHPTTDGSQTAIIAGGRYDGLIEQLGGKPTPAIGFATGIERIILNLNENQIHPIATIKELWLIAYLGVEAKTEAIKISNYLRENKQISVLAPNRSLKSQMRYASAINATKVIIIGDEELKNSTIIMKDMKTGDQNTIPLKKLTF